MHNENVLLLVLPFILLIVGYIFAVLRSNQYTKRWTLYRTSSWILGMLCITAVFIGPLAELAHTNFTAHMLGHLLLGMIAPLLIVLSAPMTLLLRCLHVKRARQLSYLLKSTPVRLVHDPLIASVLNMGGLWLLYATDLYSAMHHHIFLFLFVHIHVFLAGYLFTASIVYFDPTPHRTSYIYRTIILILSSASHAILAKYLYTHPPAGVPKAQAEKGAMLMYYGGDAVDIILIIIFCFQWYKASKPKAEFLKKGVDV
ncbi:cytochrome c oxidase assembly protein [Robertmurraya massiliosenegalensis]|uniref:cytochrome c oxidase assembly protein n=1 Tax=Robertmurraya massiliosenegalensis TaxID=1287657 RepID=UPI0002D8AEFD|nr:cytochrome c oxidase assembly protein [Robertmurraya massiliosenegalensis]